MQNLAATLAISFVVSLVSTFLVMPFLIKKLKARGLVGKDMNKAGEPEVTELGGTGVIFGFSFGLVAAIFSFTYLDLVELNLTVLLAAFLTILLVGFIGVVDDLIGWKKGLRQYQHALMPLVAALPLMAVRAGTTEMAIPLLGTVGFGIFYSLILIPVGVTGASNAFNMLAGLNGFEAGQGIIILSAMSFIAFFAGQVEATIIGVALVAALLAFIFFNWFPAKVFGGDSLTLMIGASIATISIIGNMEKIGVMMLALYFVELIIKARTKFQSECFGEIQKDGKLEPPKQKGSLTHYVMAWKRLTEKQVVLTIFALQAIVAVLVVFYSFFLTHLF
ncbi:MAG: glycosyltransferase 4 family protein [Candidatus Diapherotrites archaeon]